MWPDLPPLGQIKLFPMVQENFISPLSHSIRGHPQANSKEFTLSFFTSLNKHLLYWHKGEKTPDIYSHAHGINYKAKIDGHHWNHHFSHFGTRYLPCFFRHLMFLILKDIHVLDMNYKCFHFNLLKFNKCLWNACTLLSTVIGNLALLFNTKKLNWG